jgi:hypothetical protein
MACLGRCHAPIKSRRDIPDRRRATQRKPVRPNSRQRESESTRRRSEPPLKAGRHTESKQQAWKRACHGRAAHARPGRAPSVSTEDLLTLASVRDCGSADIAIRHDRCSSTSERHRRPSALPQCTVRSSRPACDRPARMTRRTWIVRARRKGPRTPPWAFSHGKRPQSAGKRGHRQTTRERRKSLQVSPTQSQLHTTENRGVPGSSPGLAIAKPRIAT